MIFCYIFTTERIKKHIFFVFLQIFLFELIIASRYFSLIQCSFILLQHIFVCMNFAIIFYTQTHFFRLFLLVHFTSSRAYCASFQRKSIYSYTHRFVPCRLKLISTLNNLEIYNIIQKERNERKNSDLFKRILFARVFARCTKVSW